jgi:uncharacterized membrane-anchored protein
MDSKARVATAAAFLAVLAAIGSHPAFAQRKTSQAEIDPQQERAELSRMHWISHGNLKFATSSSTLTVPPTLNAVSDNEARRVSEIFNGMPDPNVEGIVIAEDGSVVYLTYAPAGYVSLDDWADIDPDTMIESIRKNTEEGNAARTARGISALHVTGWLQKPTLDRANNQAYWAFSATSADGGRLVNAVALQLGRNGYEKLIWAGEPATFQTSNMLGQVMQARSFDQGSRYFDHIDGDKMAGYGIAALVGAIAGAKVVKVAAGLGLLVLLKKFFIVPIILVGVAFKKIAGMFKRNRAA